MFEVNDKVVYGVVGVCEIENIGKFSFMIFFCHKEQHLLLDNLKTHEQ